MYLLQLLAKYKVITIPLVASIIPTILGIWNFDFQRLFPNTMLSSDMLWKIRTGMTIALPSIYLIALIILILHDYKKIKIELETEIKQLQEKISDKNKSKSCSPQVFTPHDPELDKIKSRSLSIDE